jgi:hypothetical protein
LRIPNHFPTNLLVSSMFHDFHPGPVPGRWRKFSAVARQDLGFFMRFLWRLRDETALSSWQKNLRKMWC